MISEAVLTLILLSHIFLIRGCFKINQNLPVQGDNITHEIQGVSTIHDEMADLIHTVAESLPNMNPASTHTGSPVADLLSMFLNSKSNTANEHGNTLTEEWQVQETDSPPTLETENQPA